MPMWWEGVTYAEPSGCIFYDAGCREERSQMGLCLSHYTIYRKSGDPRICDDDTDPVPVGTLRKRHVRMWASHDDLRNAFAKVLDGKTDPLCRWLGSYYKLEKESRDKGCDAWEIANPGFVIGEFRLCVIIKCENERVRNSIYCALHATEYLPEPPQSDSVPSGPKDGDVIVRSKSRILELE